MSARFLSALPFVSGLMTGNIPAWRLALGKDIAKTELSKANYRSYQTFRSFVDATAASDIMICSNESHDYQGAVKRHRFHLKPCLMPVLRKYGSC